MFTSPMRKLRHKLICQRFRKWQRWEWRSAFCFWAYILHHSVTTSLGRQANWGSGKILQPREIGRGIWGRDPKARESDLWPWRSTPGPGRPKRNNLASPWLILLHLSEAFCSEFWLKQRESWWASVTHIRSCAPNLCPRGSGARKNIMTWVLQLKCLVFLVEAHPIPGPSNCCSYMASPR